MAFTVDDFQDLIRLLGERPEWRAELRKHVLSDELLELPAIVRQLAERMDQLVETQARTERQIGSMLGRIGHIEGMLYEDRFVDRAPAFFSRLLRRPRRVQPDRLAALLDRAADSGAITESERIDATHVDLVMSGLSKSAGDEVYYVVEVSVGVGLDDVLPAYERAQVFKKLGWAALPAVAGDWVVPNADDAARALGVILVPGPPPPKPVLRETE
jgi:hypothetical protein